MRNDLYVYYSGRWEFDPAIPFQSRYLIYKGLVNFSDEDVASIVETELLPIVRKFFDADEQTITPSRLLEKLNKSTKSC